MHILLYQEPITLSMGYTPAASRSGFQERDERSPPSNTPHTSSSLNQNNNAITDGSSHSTDGIVRSNNTLTSIRDVEVRSKPVEYSAVVETFFACTGPGAMNMVDDGTGIQHAGGARGGGMRPAGSQSSLTSMGNGVGNRPTSAGIAEVAAYVGAGGILPPGGILAAASTMTSRTNSNNGSSNRRLLPDGRDKNLGGKNFTPCPSLPQEKLLKQWNSIGSLARSMAYAACGSCETAHIESGGPFERLSNTVTGSVGGEEAFYSPTECIQLIESIANGTIITTSDGTQSQVAADEVFDAHLLQLIGVAISPSMENIENERRLNERLMDVVIDVALNDINLCQRLFFLLRAFIGLLEDQKLPPHGYYTSEKTASAVRVCRYAQRRQSGKMFDKSACRGEQFCSEGYPMNRERSSTSTMLKIAQEYENLAITASESPLGNGGKGMGREYPTQEPNVDSHSGTEGGHPLVVESSSEEMPASHSSSRENYDQNSTALESTDSTTMLKKKSKSKKILRMLKPGKPSMKSFKKPSSDQSSTMAPSVGTSTHTKSSPKASSKSAFSFPYPFSKTNSGTGQTLQTIDVAPPPPPPQAMINQHDQATNAASLSRKFENMAWILREIDNSTSAIEKTLMKTFSQKMADWALYPWSASKESALASVTATFRTELRLMNNSSSQESRFPILNPVNPTEQLTSVDADQCFILPSAHFPLLLCFNSEQHVGSPKRAAPQSRNWRLSSEGNGDTLYRTKVEILGLRSTLPQKTNEAFIVQGIVAGGIQESGVR